MLTVIPSNSIFPIESADSRSNLDHEDSDIPLSLQTSLSPETELTQTRVSSPATSIDISMSEPTSPDCFGRSIHFVDLPNEIHESILDYLFGARGSTLASITPATSTASSWSKALRHPRRKILSDLALVTRTWRRLVQERIYRHIQIKGTTDGLAECAEWFSARTYLGAYVRHIEIWVPVWGDRLRKPSSTPSNHRYNGIGTREVADATGLIHAMTPSLNSPVTGRTNCSFTFANRNATLQQIFYHVACYFPDSKMLTIEGGHCKKPPMIRYFEDDPWAQSNENDLEVLPGIRTFVMKGAWNIMREYRHWRKLSTALPNLREWQCFYSKPKLEGHVTISQVLANFPTTLTRLNISLEGFCSKSSPQSRWLNASHGEYHLCRLLGAVIPQLESLTFTGKLCACLFTSAKTAINKTQTKSRLKSVDFVVKACCWEQQKNDGLLTTFDLSGITNMAFIAAFEKLIVAAVQSLDCLGALEFMRIRFIDLDSICGLLNPYFQLVGDSCTGLWSEAILETLQQARPMAHFQELSEGILPEYGINSQTGARLYPHSRPRSIKSSAYKIIADKSKP